MIKFFKREFAPYFRDFSEYDFKFFRTFKDTFIRPTKVIEANDGTYTGELKFAFNVFTVLFIAYYLTNPTWVEHIGTYQMWKYPIPHQKYLKLQQSLEEDYYGYLTAVTFIPLYFLCLKLLFFKKKPWGYFLSASFYLTSVIFTLLIGMVFILNFLEIESVLVIIPLFVFVVIYPVVALHLQHWAVSSIKAVIASAIPLLFSSPFMIDILDNLILDIFSDEVVYEMNPSNELILAVDNLPVQSGYVIQAFQIQNEGFILLGEKKLSWIRNKEVATAIPLKDYYSKEMILLDEKGPLVIVCYHEQNETINEAVITMYSMHGDTLWNQRLSPNIGIKGLTSKRRKDGFDIFTLGYHIILQKDRSSWNVSLSREPDVDQSITCHNSRDGYLESITNTGDHHVRNYLVKAKTYSDALIWEKILYEKSGPFDPLDELSIRIDSVENKVYGHYTLANDSTYISHLYALDLKTGLETWYSAFSLPTYVTEFEGLTYDDTYIYLYGEAHKFYSNWFWQPTYHIGLLVKIDKKTGEKINQIFLGPHKNWGAHSDIHAMYTEGEYLYLLTRDVNRESLFGEDTDDVLLKKLSRQF